jgi:hypothetical protein
MSAQQESARRLQAAVEPAVAVAWEQASLLVRQLEQAAMCAVPAPLSVA